MHKPVVILEGFHVCKHAVRFDADIIELVTADEHLLRQMLIEHAPDTHDAIMSRVRIITAADFANYSNICIRTPLAGKAYVSEAHIVSDTDKPVVLLDNPRDLENIGAVVRLAAGMDCAAVVTTGDVNPWHKNCLRGSQGLHFALPVRHIDQLDGDYLDDKELYAFDERGDNITNIEFKSDKQAVLVFGSERAGLSVELKKRSNYLVTIPQRTGVASYNLATSVAMAVYDFKYSK